MNHSDDMDALLAARFEREHRQLPDQPFVGSTLRVIQLRRRWMATLRAGLGLAVFLLLVVASPWLVNGASRINAALESSLSVMTGMDQWAFVLLAAVVFLAMRVRSR